MPPPGKGDLCLRVWYREPWMCGLYTCVSECIAMCATGVCMCVSTGMNVHMCECMQLFARFISMGAGTAVCTYTCTQVCALMHMRTVHRCVCPCMSVCITI